MVQEKDKPVVDVTMILNVWKRNYLDEQLGYLMNQTHFPRYIWIIRYERLTEIENIIEKYRGQFPSITLIESEKNLKYFGRFSIAMFVETEFTWILDDDVMPSPAWLETALKKCKAHNALISCTGRIIAPDDFEPEKPPKLEPEKYFIGDEPPTLDFNICSKDTIVDYGCNSYFFCSSWIKHFWAIWPYTFHSGEDMHFAATLKIRAGVKTVVPAQHSLTDTGNTKKIYGSDEHSSWLGTGFYDTRRDILKYLILEKKWKPIMWS